jgi:hypothetical protein
MGSGPWICEKPARRQRDSINLLLVLGGNGLYEFVLNKILYNKKALHLKKKNGQQGRWQKGKSKGKDTSIKNQITPGII